MNERPEHDAAAYDDLNEYDDLVSALQAPGSVEELADEQTFLAAYRAAQPGSATVVSLPRRLARRLGAGGTAVVVAAVVGTSGVAAAVTGHLPDPVQEIAHSVLGAPAPQAPAPLEVTQAEILPEAAAPTPTPSAPSSPPSSIEPTPEPSAEPGTTERDGRSPTPLPEPSKAPQSPEPSADPDPEPTPVVPVPPRQIPASVSIGAGDHLAPYGGILTLSGVLLDADGAPVADRKVILQVKGAAGWRRVTRVRSDPAGVVAAPTAPVTGLSRYRWRARPNVRSEAWRVRVQASLTASYAVQGDRTVVAARAIGGARGAMVTFFVRTPQGLSPLGSVPLAADGQATLALPTPKRNRVVVLRLERTVDHTAARAKVVVSPPE